MIAMNTWHHLTPSRTTATVAEDGLDELVKSGALTPQTMVWTDGMADQRGRRFVARVLGELRFCA